MAEYSRRVMRTTRVEFSVPAAEPWGACWVEVMKAIRAATRELVEAGRLAEGADPSDDTIRIRVGDDEVIVCYEHTDEADST